MRILCGYNVNIDSVYIVNGLEISKCIKEYNLSEKIKTGLKNPPNAINKLEDFFVGLIDCINTGKGAEWLILDKGVFEFLKKNFHGELRIGGNAGIMSNVLAELSTQVITNVPKLSEEQAKLFSEKVLVPAEQENKITLKNPRYAIKSDEELMHFVFDFKRGTIINIKNEKFIATRENRFIATYDESNTKLEINPLFDLISEKLIKNIDGALISGFHILLKNYPNGTTYKEQVKTNFEQVKKWKQLNKNLIIHLELGHFNSDIVMEYIINKFSSVVDSIGMNEDELSKYLGIIGEKDLKNNVNSNSARPIIEALLKLKNTLILPNPNLRRICVHTREFIISILKNCRENYEILALKFGAKVAATLAKTGKIGNEEYIEESIKDLKLSEIGIQQLKEVQPYLNGTFSENYSIIMSPTILCGTPVTSVGMGDSLTAGIFLKELELDVFKRVKINLNH
ncbi:MAG: ADP-dependent glucokinase/phosphofructokinase [Methanosarcinales archaeon]